ncbi:uncharacterized protein LOC144702074 [Wolffia australiana]
MTMTMTMALPAVTVSGAAVAGGGRRGAAAWPAARKAVRICAQLGGGGGGDDAKKASKKKFITREQEPEQYWQTAGEREGENPMKTPLPYIIIFGMSTPFIILAVAFANGWIKVPIR